MRQKSRSTDLSSEEIVKDINAVERRALVGSADFDPDTLAVVYAAFDNAWAEAAPHVSGQPSAMEAARTTLADLILAWPGTASATWKV